MPLPLIFAQFMQAYCTAQCPTSIYMEKFTTKKKIWMKAQHAFYSFDNGISFLSGIILSEENIWDMNSFDIHRTIFLSMLFLWYDNFHHIIILEVIFTRMGKNMIMMNLLTTCWLCIYTLYNLYWRCENDPNIKKWFILKMSLPSLHSYLFRLLFYIFDIICCCCWNWCCVILTT